MTGKRYPVVKSNRTLYRYIITKRLGGGGFGEVYQAFISDLRMYVALKQFRLRPGNTAAVLDNWSRESATHDSLSHPNILQVFDAFEHNGYLYMATELATASLDKCTAAGGWDEAEVVRAGMQIASGLHYIHTAWGETGPLIHRDITPNNIFYFQEKSIFKIGDFGIATQLDGEDGVAVTQIANWSWVAPELIRDGFRHAQSDLFQLGLVLYFMAQGESAIDAALSISEKKRLIADGEAYRRASEAIFLDDELQGCIKKLLLRNLDKRYRSAEDVFTDLRTIRLNAQKRP